MNGSGSSEGKAIGNGSTMFDLRARTGPARKAQLATEPFGCFRDTTRFRKWERQPPREKLPGRNAIQEGTLGSIAKCRTSSRQFGRQRANPGVRRFHENLSIRPGSDWDGGRWAATRSAVPGTSQLADRAYGRRRLAAFPRCSKVCRSRTVMRGACRGPYLSRWPRPPCP